MKKTAAPMKIGAVVKALGIPASTLRYYEKISLLRPTTRISNSRCYDKESLLRLRFIQMAQAVGFSITEIKQLLGVFSKNQDANQQSCDALVQTKLNEMQQKITDLQKMQSALKLMKDCNCASLQSCVELSVDVKNKVAPTA